MYIYVVLKYFISLISKKMSITTDALVFIVTVDWSFFGAVKSTKASITRPHVTVSNSEVLSLVTEKMQQGPLKNADEEPDSSAERLSSSEKPVPRAMHRFDEIQLRGELFVDKTHFIRKLIDEDNSQFYFLSRPKRFGKTTFLRMLFRFLDGNSSYFRDTAILDRGNKVEGDGKWVRYPVIYIDFTDIPVTGNGEKFQRLLQKELTTIAISYGLSPQKDLNIGILIRDLEQKYHLPVSVLVDEYDEPLSSSILSKTTQKQVISILSTFYKQLKARIENLRLVFVSGVSKLHILGNGLTVFKDLTFDREYTSILGFTGEEFEINFKPHIEDFAKNQSSDYEGIKKDMEGWYGWYRFGTDEETKVLNPGSTCKCLETYKLGNHLTKADILDQVVNEMKCKKFNVEYFKYFLIDEDEMSNKYSSIVEEIPLHIFMHCNGYLTIKRYYSKTREVLLSYPSKEVERSIKTAFSTKFPKLKAEDKSSEAAPLKSLHLCEAVHRALEDYDVSTFIDILDSCVFPAVSETLRPTQTDEFPSTYRVFSVLKSFQIDYEEGSKLIDSNLQRKGDIDVLIIVPKPLKYVIEMKYKSGAVMAIWQIIQCIIENEEAFRKAIRLTGNETVYLVGIDVRFRQDKGYQEINEWISLPFRDEKIWISEMIASKQEKLMTKLKSQYNNVCVNNLVVKSSNKIVWS